ncbi:MAG TPA: galactose-1-phosphate uridylyltransferase [Acidimicrobiia bacterium]|nr:galactose-1-phosphate uridylyltransferase [Acidimicrobiia bacterium]
MPELRRDQLTDRWVLLVPGRAARPHTFPPARGDAGTTPADCPFCPGHEHMTPPEVERSGAGAPETPGWRVRVVPNLYPIVGGDDAEPGATGAHEVAVLSPAHGRSFAQLEEAQAAEVLMVLRDRTRHHLRAGRAFVQVVINHGAAAGASIEHPHAQLVALDFVPPAVEYSVGRGKVAAGDLVLADLERAGEAGRVLDGAAPSWCPHAASAPFEFRVALRAPGARFDDAGDAQVEALAQSARSTLARLAAVLGDVPYNLVVHTAPPGVAPDAFHWYVEVQTRIAVVAGFEQGTGILVNTTPPELAASRLRDAG